VDSEVSEITSLILISCYELTFIGKIICYIWRMLFDNLLSTVLTKLTTIHEKLIRLNVSQLTKMKNMNWISIVMFIVNVMVVILSSTLFLIMHKHLFGKKEMVIILI